MPFRNLRGVASTTLDRLPRQRDGPGRNRAGRDFSQIHKETTPATALPAGQGMPFVPQGADWHAKCCLGSGKATVPSLRREKSMQSERHSVESRYTAWGRPARAGRARRGSEIVELVIILPVLILIGLGIVSFGIFYSNRQQVALAARVGAEEASQTAGLDTTSDWDPVPQDILDAITDQLESSCIQVYEVRLEHNVGGTPVVLRSPGTGTCPCGPDDTLPPCQLLGKYVRVTVCVEMEELMPNFLAAFGSSVCGKVAQATTVFHYEL